MEEVIRSAVEDVLQELGIEPVDFAVEHPSDLAHGDYACNVAMVAAKQVGKAPRAIAEQLLAALDGEFEYVEKIEIAGPGFLNFYLSRDFFVQEIGRANDHGPVWGKNNDLSGQTVIVEYTDPNPFKELHIGHLVPNALGESVARLFMYSGADTKRVTFQGDVGMHVAKCIYGLLTLGVGSDDITAAKLGEAYAKGATLFEESDSVQAEVKELNIKIYERSDEGINALYDKGKEVSLAYFETAYLILGSAFDHNFFESVTGPVGLELVKAHIGDIFKESDGAVIFEGEQYGLHTRVFINKEGLPTYETKDVGLIKCKHDWQPFDLAITVTGTEQTEYFKVTTKASTLIQPDLAGKVELVPNGMLRLAEGKMSSRTGNIVRALDLIQDVQAAALAKMKESGVTDAESIATQVAIGALKYTILKIAAGKDIVFDLKKSVSFEGDSGPYLQYTNARINSVMEKAATAGISASTQKSPDVPYDIEKILYRFPEVVEQAREERAPHHLVVYLTELAGTFNTFYAKEKIVDPTDEFAPYKLALTQAVGQTLKNGLWVLGIEAPVKM